MAQKAGFNARVMLNGTAYAWARYEWNTSSPILDTTNGEGVTGSGSDGEPGHESNVAGNRKATISIRNATYDDDSPEFSTPLSLRDGDVIEVLIYPDRDNEEYYANFPAVRIGNLKMEGDIKNLQVVSFDGSTDGLFYLPGESAA